MQKCGNATQSNAKFSMPKPNSELQSAVWVVGGVAAHAHTYTLAAC